MWLTRSRLVIATMGAGLLLLTAVAEPEAAAAPADGPDQVEAWGTRQTLAKDGTFRVATDGDTIAVDGNGAVEVFARSANGWELVQTIGSPTGRKDDLFGGMFDLDGDVMAVTQANWAKMEFAVHVFERRGGRWEHTTELEDMEAASLAVSHGVIAISGFDLATPRYDHGVYLYEKPDGRWKRTGEIPSWGDVGCSPSTVDLWRDRLVVGVDHNHDPCIPTVHAYRRYGNSWVREQRLTTTKGEGSFGAWVAVWGNTIAVGDIVQERDPPTERLPKVRIFTWDGKKWERTQVLKRYRHAFGGAVALHRNTLVVGDTDQGGAWVFTRFGRGFQLARKLPLGGRSVAVWGPLVVNGGPGLFTDRPGRVDAFHLTRCRGYIPTLVGTDGPDVLIGDDFARDVIHGAGGDDRIDAQDRHDLVCGGGGNDLLIGGQGSDILIGGYGDDIIRGKAGPDTLLGSTGDDTLDGGRGDDTLDGGSGVDRLDGGGDTDTCTCGEAYVGCEIIE